MTSSDRHSRVVAAQGLHESDPAPVAESVEDAELGIEEPEFEMDEAPGAAMSAVPLGVLPLRDNVFFPGLVAPLNVMRPGSVRMLEDLPEDGERVIAIFAMRDPSIESPTCDNLYQTGVVAAIRAMVKVSEGYRIVLQGLSRVHLIEPLQESPYIRCLVVNVTETEPTEFEEAEEIPALREELTRCFHEIVRRSPVLPDELHSLPSSVEHPGELVDQIAAHLPFSVEEKDEILQEGDVLMRVRRMTELLSEKLSIAEAGSKIAVEAIPGGSTGEPRIVGLKQMEPNGAAADSPEVRERIEDPEATDDAAPKGLSSESELGAETVSQDSLPGELSILPLRDNVFFPGVVAPLNITRDGSIKLIDDAAVAENRIIGIVTLKNPEAENPTFADLHPYGVATAIRIMIKGQDGVRLILQGLRRIRLLEPVQDSPYIRCRVEEVQEVDRFEGEAEVEVRALQRNLSQGFQRIVQMSPHLPDELQGLPQSVKDPGTLADLIAAHLQIDTAEKEAILEELDVRNRLRRLATLIQQELNVLEVGSKIQDEVSSEMNRMQREYFLREQMKAIQKELGEGEDRANEIQEIKAKIESCGMPEEARKEADRELERLQRMPPAAAEYTVARTYLDWLTTLPWKETTTDNLEIAAVRDVLNTDHFGLEKVKDRILEFLSVRKFKAQGDVRQPILCLAGPPGVGKTSLGKSIARALGRNFYRFSVGGIRDEAEIRGHRRTYVGAMPGQVIQGMRRAGSMNPVLMLDEIDKVGQDFRGDPSSALLEVLDPEQNKDFRDHYLDVPFDLSNVLFITTANMLDTIIPALRDRMEIIELPGYTEEEKVQISRRHLIPKQLEEHGIPENQITWDDAAIPFLVAGYTREAGVRNLEREVAAITRKATREFAEGREEPVHITAEQVGTYLGSPRFESEEVKDRVSSPGVATGMFYTPVGGGVLFVEAIALPEGKGALTLTGQLGDVMKESAQAALSYVRAHRERFGVSSSFFQTHDIHVHVPAGAVPKDGPSAGVALATALASLVTGRITRRQVAMTGEITLTGRVLPVGGIKEKVLAARRAGIREIILPERNRKDVEEDLPDTVKEALTFHYVKEIQQALELALDGTEEAASETAGAAPAEEPPARPVRRRRKPAASE